MECYFKKCKAWDWICVYLLSISGKIKQTWKVFKNHLALLPPAGMVLCFLLCSAVPCACGFNQVQSRNSTSCCLTLIRRSQILQIGRFLLLVILFDESFAFKYLKGTISKAAPSLLLFFDLFIISHSKEPNTDPLYLLNWKFRNTAKKNGYLPNNLNNNSSDQWLWC